MTIFIISFSLILITYAFYDCFKYFDKDEFISRLIVVSCIIFFLCISSLAFSSSVKLNTYRGDLWVFVRNNIGWEVMEGYNGLVIDTKFPYTIAVSESFNGGFPDKDAIFFNGNNKVIEYKERKKND